VLESAVVMGREALRALGIAEREVGRVEREYRVRDSERLRLQSESGDLKSGMEQSLVHRPLEDNAEEVA
jgi:glutathione-regulated potassium-efflux system protein KefB